MNICVCIKQVPASSNVKINPETGQKDYRIGSCVAVAPSDDPEIAVLIMVDEPNCSNRYGSSVAAPASRKVMEKYFFQK